MHDTKFEQPGRVKHTGKDHFKKAQKEVNQPKLMISPWHRLTGTGKF